MAARGEQRWNADLEISLARLAPPAMDRQKLYLLSDFHMQFPVIPCSGGLRFTDCLESLIGASVSVRTCLSKCLLAGIFPVYFLVLAESSSLVTASSAI
jgi:hypothetical protein